MPDLLVVWTPGSLAGALAGGAGLGLVLSRLDDARYSLRMGWVISVLLGTAFMGVFWSSQLVDTWATDGPGNALRVASRFMLSVVYVVALASGSTLGSWHSRRERRQRAVGAVDDLG